MHFEDALNDQKIKFHATCIDYEHFARKTWHSKINQSEHRMELQFKNHIGMLHEAAESTELSERNALMDAVRRALQE